MTKIKEWANEKAQNCKEWTKNHSTEIYSAGLGAGIALMLFESGRAYQFMKYQTPLLVELAKKTTELKLLKE